MPSVNPYVRFYENPLEISYSSVEKTEHIKKIFEDLRTAGIVD